MSRSGSSIHVAVPGKLATGLNGQLGSDYVTIDPGFCFQREQFGHGNLSLDGAFNILILAFDLPFYFTGLPYYDLTLGNEFSGKTTFHHAHLAPSGLRNVNTDVLARELGLEPYAAALVAQAIRTELVRQR